MPVRVEGLKRATAVCVGEKHSLALQSWWSAPTLLDANLAAAAAAAAGADNALMEGVESSDRGFESFAGEEDEGEDPVLLCERVRMHTSLLVGVGMPFVY